MIQPQYSQPMYSQAPSAVSINIYEPKSYGSAQPQSVPYGYTNQLYAMPETSAWAPQAQSGVQSPYQQYAANPIVPQYAPVAPVAPQPMPTGSNYGADTGANSNARSPTGGASSKS